MIFKKEQLPTITQWVTEAIANKMCFITVDSESSQIAYASIHGDYALEHDDGEEDEKSDSKESGELCLRFGQCFISLFAVQSRLRGFVLFSRWSSDSVGPSTPRGNRENKLALCGCGNFAPCRPRFAARSWPVLIWTSPLRKPNSEAFRFASARSVWP